MDDFDEKKYKEQMSVLDKMFTDNSEERFEYLASTVLGVINLLIDKGIITDDEIKKHIAITKVALAKEKERQEKELQKQFEKEFGAAGNLFSSFFFGNKNNEDNKENE